MNRTAQLGESPWITAGSLSTWLSPSTPMTTNQMRMTGPNNQPIVPEPKRWSTNSPIRMATDSGTTRCARSGVATLTP